MGDGAEFSLPSATKSEPSRGVGKQDVVLTRAINAAKGVAARHSQQSLSTLRADCRTLSRALDVQLGEARQKGRAASNNLRMKLMQFAGALVIVGMLVPFVLEEDVEKWLVNLWIGIAVGVAVVLLTIAYFMPPPTTVDSRFGE